MYHKKDIILSPPPQKFKPVCVHIYIYIGFNEYKTYILLLCAFFVDIHCRTMRSRVPLREINPITATSNGAMMVARVLYVLGLAPRFKFPLNRLLSTRLHLIIYVFAHKIQPVAHVYIFCTQCVQYIYCI